MTTYVVITGYNADKRVDTYLPFDTQGEADTFAASQAIAFVTERPAGGPSDWLVDDSDENNKTLSDSPDATIAAAQALQAVYDARTESIANGGYGTEGERAEIAYDAYIAEQGTDTEKAVAAAKALVDHATTVKTNHPKP